MNRGLIRVKPMNQRYRDMEVSEDQGLECAEHAKQREEKLRGEVEVAADHSRCSFEMGDLELKTLTPWFKQKMVNEECLYMPVWNGMKLRVCLTTLSPGVCWFLASY